MPPLADNSYGPPQGVPIPAHDLRMNGSNGAAGSNGNISYSESGTHVNQMYGANPAPGWSSRKYYANKHVFVLSILFTVKKNQIKCSLATFS